ncbi:MAG TPA: DNRLRE domain-containing protein [Ruminiclostridium sp.]|nr:DNRLRE domain-containing protein [Ruminiclostridium sp.]
MSVITLIQTFEDTYINSAAPDINYNSSPVFWVGEQGSSTFYRTLIKFDLSFIPVGSSIISSNLNLYMDYDASDVGLETTITPYAVIDSWDVSGVTWGTRSALNNFITGGSTNVSIPGYYSFNVTELIDKWVNGGLTNNGMELKAEELELFENKRFVSSNESDPDKQAYKPVLVIQYDPGRAVSTNINAVITGHDVDTAHETVITSDTYQVTETRNTSDRTLVSFFVNNLSVNKADVGIEVSTDGINFLRENYNTVSQGMQIFIPGYYATYTRLFYKSNVDGNPATLSIDYVAQA